MDINNIYDFEAALKSDQVDTMIIKADINLSNFSWDYSATSGTLKIIKGDVATRKLTLPAVVLLGCDTTFQNIRLVPNQTPQGYRTDIFASGKVFVWGLGMYGTDKINIYGGKDNESMDGNTSININSAGVGKVYGGGRGLNGVVNGNTNITVNNAYVNGVYGGGENAHVTGDAIVIFENKGNCIGNVYGGGQSDGVQSTVVPIRGVGGSTYIIFKGSSITGTGILYGGGENRCADVSGNTNIIFESSSCTGIYGGGYGSDIRGNTSITVQGVNAKVTGEIVGGGNNGSVLGATNINFAYGQCAIITGGSVGGNSISNGSTFINISGGNVTSYISGGSKNGAVTNGNTNITIDGIALSLTNIYGGGYNSYVNGNTNITLNGTTLSSGTVYGGGNGGSVQGITNITIYNGTVNQVYGGGYGSALTIYTGSTNINMNNVTINSNVYGGGYNVTVNGDTNITLDSMMKLVNVYGGGNSNAVINGSTNVTLKNTKMSTIFIYGGGYSGSVEVDTNVILDDNIFSSTVYICGGGYSSIVKKNTNVTLNNDTFPSAYVYGGEYNSTIGSAINGNTNITLNNSIFTSTSTCIYGGCNKGNVSGNTNITVKGSNSDIKGKIIGGGNNGNVVGTTNINVIEGSINNLTASGMGTSVNCSTGSTYVDVKGGYINEILGGGGSNKVSVLGDTHIDIKGGSIRDGVWGASGASISGSTYIIMSGGVVPFIKGGAKDSCKIYGNTNITITGDPVINDGIYGDGVGVIVGEKNLTYDSYGSHDKSINIKTINNLYNLDNVYIKNTYFTVSSDIRDSTNPKMVNVGTLFLTSGRLIISNELTMNAALGGGDGLLVIENDITFTVNRTVAPPQIRAVLTKQYTSAKAFIKSKDDNGVLAGHFSRSNDIYPEQISSNCVKLGWPYTFFIYIYK